MPTRERDLTSHVYGQQEQQLAVIVRRNGQPVVAIPIERPIEQVVSPDGRRLHVRTGSRTWSMD